MSAFKNKDIKTLLQLMLDNQECFSSGLCGWASMLPLSYVDWTTLNKYIKKNRPSMFSSKQAFLHCFDCYYWNEGDIEPRLKWIKKHIKKLSK
jgi:hypothetical protein